ncbi:MAG: adenylosuccinate synthetase [Desulfurococcaceae archaeon TW002]
MLSVVVGGFFGDEGKGKVVAYLALNDEISAAVRVGSVNAGHTVFWGGKEFKLRIIPSAFVNGSCKLYIAAGSLVRLDVFFREVTTLGVAGRVFVDKNAGIIEDKHVETEARDEYLRNSIGSTLQGVGAAMVDRVMRKLKLAQDFPELRTYLVDLVDEIWRIIDSGDNILIEGTQGTYLSLYHGTYPYVTSRDTTASGILSEVGLGPKYVDEVIIVFKSYVTRVGGGPLPGELSIDEVINRGWIEKASVTGRIRRAAPFDYYLAKRAVMLNSATQVALTCLDKTFPTSARVKEWGKLPPEARKWVEDLEDLLRTPVTLIGTGDDVTHMIDRRKDLGVMR